MPLTVRCIPMAPGRSSSQVPLAIAVLARRTSCLAAPIRVPMSCVVLWSIPRLGPSCARTATALGRLPARVRRPRPSARRTRLLRLPRLAPRARPHLSRPVPPAWWSASRFRARVLFWVPWLRRLSVPRSSRLVRMRRARVRPSISEPSRARSLL